MIDQSIIIFPYIFICSLPYVTIKHDNGKMPMLLLGDDDVPPFFLPIYISAPVEDWTCPRSPGETLPRSKPSKSFLPLCGWQCYLLLILFNTWDCEEKTVSFLMTQNHVIVFFTRIVFSGGELPVDKKCDFSSFLWVWKHPWSRVNCHLLCSFPFIKDTGFRKLICSNRSYPPKCSRFFHMSWAFLLSFSYRFGGLCRLPSSGFMNMYLYKLVIVFFNSYRFLGRQCIGSVKVQAKLKWNDRGYYTIPPVDTFYVFVSPCSKLNRTQMHKEST